MTTVAASTPNFADKTVWTGDNLGILRGLNSRCVDLIPGKGMQSYLCMMAVRLLEMRRVLKDTGSIYLHCDPTASHYLKMLMDSIYGIRNFRNEIIRKRSDAKGNTGQEAKHVARVNDSHSTAVCALQPGEGGIGRRSIWWRGCGNGWQIFEGGFAS